MPEPQDPRPRSRRRCAPLTDARPALLRHTPWASTVTTVFLAALSFWCLNVQVAAGISANTAAAAVVVILLCIGQISGAAAGASRLVAATNHGQGRR